MWSQTTPQFPSATSEFACKVTAVTTKRCAGLKCVTDQIEDTSTAVSTLGILHYWTSRFLTCGVVHKPDVAVPGLTDHWLTNSDSFLNTGYFCMFIHSWVAQMIPFFFSHTHTPHTHICTSCSPKCLTACDSIFILPCILIYQAVISLYRLYSLTIQCVFFPWIHMHASSSRLHPACTTTKLCADVCRLRS